MGKNREIAEPNVILRVEVGSTVHGVSVDDQDDRDEMGVCLEPPHYVVGLGHFEQWEYRDALERAKAAGQPTNPAPRSQPGDLDLTVFSLRKWAKLALNGNPSKLLLLFSPKIVLTTPAGDRLRSLAPAFASKRVVRAYLGYMREQRERLTGERGQRNVNRPELVAKYGFDTKFAYHMLRLGFQGLEYALTTKLELPMPPDTRQYLLEVRLGQHSLQSVLLKSMELEKELETELERDLLPDNPHMEVVDQFIQDEYQAHWNWYPDALVRDMVR
jgi:predicted nucleotidyltransferase